MEKRKPLHTSLPILAIPRTAGQITVSTDDYDSQAVCLLLQKHDDSTTSPINYWSRSIISDEQNLATTNQKYLTILWAVLLLRLYVELCRFIIRTYDGALKWSVMSADASEK